jgi:hypothetical protein
MGSIDDASALAKIRDAVSGKTKAEAAEALGVSKAVVGNALTLLRKVGVEIETKRPAGVGGAKPRFDTAVVERLFAANVEVSDIAKHVGAKTSRVYAYLRKSGIIKPKIAIEDALKQISGSVEGPAPDQQQAA